AGASAGGSIFGGGRGGSAGVGDRPGGGGITGGADLADGGHGVGTGAPGAADIPAADGAVRGGAGAAHGAASLAAVRGGCDPQRSRVDGPVGTGRQGAAVGAPANAGTGDPGRCDLAGAGVAAADLLHQRNPLA